MRIFVDIDGTLTDTPEAPYGKANEKRLAHVRGLIAAGHTVVLWSAMGGEYADKFATTHRLKVAAAIGKPDVFIDDNPTIRHSWDGRRRAPEILDK